MESVLAPSVLRPGQLTLLPHGLARRQPLFHRQPAPVGRRCPGAPVRPAAVAELSRAAPAPTTPTFPAEDAVTIANVGSGEEFADLLAANPSRMVVLMCKAKGCHPCKAFRGKYARLAQHYSDAVFAEIMGDRNESTRSLMKSMKVRATPTFAVYRDGERVHMHSGVNARKLIDALVEHTPGSAAGAGATAADLEEAVRQAGEEED